MAVYKSPGVYTRDSDYWIPVRKYSSFNRKVEINKIFNLEIDLYTDSILTNQYIHTSNLTSNYRKTFIIPIGGTNNKINIINTLKQYMSYIRI
jgi:hypothetical protein